MNLFEADSQRIIAEIKGTYRGNVPSFLTSNAPNFVDWKWIEHERRRLDTLRRARIHGLLNPIDFSKRGRELDRENRQLFSDLIYLLSLIKPVDIFKE